MHSGTLCKTAVRKHSLFANYCIKLLFMFLHSIPTFLKPVVVTQMIKNAGEHLSTL